MFALFDSQSVFAQSEEEKKPTSTSARARTIFGRAKALTGSVITVSKNAKGVGSSISNRKVWEEIAKAPAFKNVVKEAENFQKESIPLPTEEDYMAYYESQADSYADINRDYERKFYQRRDRLFRLVLAECFENKGRFLTDIEEVIYVICNETVWTIPWDDHEAKKFLGENRSIDHQIARTAWNLATADYWLGRKLSPDTRELLRGTIAMRVLSIFEEAILTDNYGLIGWANDAGHRNADCHAAVVGTALALIDSPGYRAQYIAAAEYNVEKFLKIFTKDGYFSDGVWAWNEGYGSFILLAEMMYQATDGRIDMFKRPNIKETALYGPRMEITPGVYESFGDRWRGDRPNIFPTAFISKRFQMGLTEYENRAPFFGIGPGHLYQIGVYCFPNSATEEKGLPGAVLKPPVETFRSEFPLNGVMILRSGKKDPGELGVQLKGGNNDERNNHSDVGNYVVAIGGAKPLIDIGGRHNRRGLVIKDRMQSNFINSFGHSVPRINEQLQKNGKGTTALLLTRDYSDEKDLLKFDLSPAYEWAEPKDLKELTRTFVFDRSGKDSQVSGKSVLTVTDRFRNKKPMAFENCLITFGPYKKLTDAEDAKEIELIIGEDANAIHVAVTNEVVEIDPNTNKYVKSPKTMIFEAGKLDEGIGGQRDKRTPLRLSFGFETLVDEVTMTVKVRPATSSERNLAKSNPGEIDRTYASPIDQQDLFVGENAKPEDVYAKYLEIIKRSASPAMIALFKQASKDDLKDRYMMMKKNDKNLRDLPDIPEDQIDVFIDYLKENL